MHRNMGFDKIFLCRSEKIMQAHIVVSVSQFHQDLEFFLKAVKAIGIYLFYVPCICIGNHVYLELFSE